MTELCAKECGDIYTACSTKLAQYNIINYISKKYDVLLETNFIKKFEILVKEIH